MFYNAAFKRFMGADRTGELMSLPSFSHLCKYLTSDKGRKGRKFTTDQDLSQFKQIKTQRNPLVPRISLRGKANNFFEIREGWKEMDVAIRESAASVRRLN